MAKTKRFFEPVDTKVNFPDMEEAILKDWYKKGVAKKYREKNKSARKRFAFLDGPITANNPMGVHHAWGRTYKDLWQRFFNMQGFRQRFQNGFDCQGLWVEVEVEKELKLKNKRDIENLVQGDKKKSIAKFVDLCKKRVYKYADIQTEQSKRLGFFMDWENSYFTLSDENNYAIWSFLEKCSKMGLIYKGRDSVPWCPRCGTAISQHEMLTEDYKEITHDSLYVSFPLKTSSDSYLLIWTTTPWTLPANVAVAIDPKSTYVLAESFNNPGKKFYMMKEAADRLGLKPLKKIRGRELKGLRYESPFDDLPRVKKALGKYKHKVIVTDEKILEVSKEEGTGLVHIAPGTGSEDFQLSKKEDLPVIDVIDEEASYLSGLGDFAGKNAKKDPQVIIDFLNDKGFVLKTEKYKHRYPACWRCKTELVWRVVDEWYIAIEPLRQSMKEVAKKIRWIPEFGLKRELDWLENMHDWLISKKRYWGLALPIWECENCKSFEVIGGYDELRKKAVSGWGEFEGNSPHRPWIDEVKIECKKCGNLSSRIPDVGNPWLDAGIVPFSTVSKNNKGKPLYWKSKREWKKWFPADFITESFPGQFKNWFYSLIAMSTVMEKKEPFKTVLGFATLLAEDGRPMHKSWGNAIEFNEGAEKIGVDVMRWMYARQNPSDNLLFGYKVADETRRRFHIKLWNIYNYFVTYANLDGWSPKRKRPPHVPRSRTALDRWILSRIKETHEEVTNCLSEFDAYSASALLEEFVDDFSNWYIRRSRDRTGATAKSEKDKKRFYETSYYVLYILTLLLAPFTPFLTEAIFRNLFKKESVHLEDWPLMRIQESEKLLSEMKIVRDISEKVHSIRKTKKIPVRQPLSKLTVKSQESKPRTEVLKILADELNVKNVEWNKEKEESVSLDTKITKDLEEEAKIRDLIRQIQQKRKEMGVGLDQKIKVFSPWLPEKSKLSKKLKKVTLAEELNKGKFNIKVIK